MSNSISLDLVARSQPLTVITVDHAISQDEAEHIHEQFRLAVKDDRPVIVIGPDTSVTVLEPWRDASHRAWFALIISVLSLIIATTALVILLAFT